MENEIWKDIPGFEGYYQVSNLGRIKSLERVVACSVRLGGFRTKGETIRKQDIGSKGYHRVYLQKDKIGKKYLVHRLVAEAFVANPNNFPQVNHKDENKGNNKASNLEWCTAEYNSNYGGRTRLTSIAKYKPISLFDKEGHLIRDFDSLKEAGEYLGVKRISPKCLLEHHSLRGFQIRLKGERCGPYVENRGKTKRK